MRTLAQAYVRRHVLPPHDQPAINGASISLEVESGTQLGLELLARRYATETISYTNLEVDLMSRPQVTAEECARMAKVLYLLGAYFFANGGQMVSLTWLALFWGFEMP